MQVKLTHIKKIKKKICLLITTCQFLVSKTTEVCRPERMILSSMNWNFKSYPLPKSFNAINCGLTNRIQYYKYYKSCYQIMRPTLYKSWKLTKRRDLNATYNTLVHNKFFESRCVPSWGRVISDNKIWTYTCWMYNLVGECFLSMYQILDPISSSSKEKKKVIFTRLAYLFLLGQSGYYRPSTTHTDHKNSEVKVFLGTSLFQKAQPMFHNYSL